MTAMSEIVVAVNGRSYEIRCDDGQEERVRRLAAEVDRRTSVLARSLGPVGEARLLLLAALVLTDELADVQARLVQARTAAPLGRGRPEPTVPEDQEREMSRLCKRIETLALRIEAVAARLQAT
jgi:cell division protein ZapA